MDKNTRLKILLSAVIKFYHLPIVLYIDKFYNYCYSHFISWNIISSKKLIRICQKTDVIFMFINYYLQNY